MANSTEPNNSASDRPKSDLHQFAEWFAPFNVDLDLLGWVEPIGNYDALLKNCQMYPIGSLSVKVTSLDDLIRIKQHIRRPKDVDSLYQLLAVKRVREETGQK